MGQEQQKTDMSTAEIEDRMWELANVIDICMFTTWDGDRQRARPLSARVDRDAHAVYFLVDIEGEKNAQIEKFPVVTLTWTDSSGYKYVSMTGQAKVSNDRAKIKDLWTSTDKAWWDDENDPAIRLVTFDPDDGELWDSPNKFVAGAKMLMAAVTGAKPDMGDNAKTAL